MKSKLICFFILFTFVLHGCLADLITISNNETDFSGDWSGFVLSDGSSNSPNTTKPDNMVYLKLNQDNKSITGNLVTLIPGLENAIQENISGTVANNKTSFDLSLVDIILEKIDDNNLLVNWTTLYGQSGNLYLTKTQVSQYFNSIPLINENKLDRIGGTGTPVIFIHGFNSNSEAWDDMIEELNKKGFLNNHEVWTYQYNWLDNISDNGADLLEKINNANIKSPPILISHSMGGLVARSYIAKGGQINKLVTIGTPNTGFTFPSTMTSLMPWLNTTGMGDLSSSSDFMKELNQNENDINNRSNYYTWAGTISGSRESDSTWSWANAYHDSLKIPWMLISEDNDGIVPVSSALLDNTNKEPTQNLDHIDLTNPYKAVDILNFINSL